MNVRRRRTQRNRIHSDVVVGPSGLEPPTLRWIDLQFTIAPKSFPLSILFLSAAVHNFALPITFALETSLHFQRSVAFLFQIFPCRLALLEKLLVIFGLHSLKCSACSSFLSYWASVSLIPSGCLSSLFSAPMFKEYKKIDQNLDRLIEYDIIIKQFL